MEEPDLFSYKATPKPEEKVFQPSPAPPEAEASLGEEASTPLASAEANTPLDQKENRSTARSLVVSIHDVSPLTREATERILGELKEIGVRKVSLLVVPDHHCKGHFLDDPDFCSWLKERAAGGDEVVIHGYNHRRNQQPGETFMQKLATRYYTAGEGEFYDMHGADALRIISQARQDFRRIGIEPQGFVAPAWLVSEGTELALRRLGIAYTTRIGGVFDYKRNVEHASQSLVWSTRSGWRRLLSRLWNPYLFRKLQDCSLLRIGIHPPDVSHCAVWRQIKALAARALENRAPVTYAQFLKES